MGNDRIVCKLDRAMCNVKWMLNEIKGFAEFQSMGISVHSPAVVTAREAEIKETRPFKSLNCWADDGQVLDIVGRV